MTSLIDELEQMASTPNVPVCDLLRKAKIVAVKLRQTNTSAWIDFELSGRSETCPEYRKVPVKLMYRNPFQGMQPLMFEDAAINETVNQPRDLTQSIKEIEEIASGGENAVFMGIPPSIVQTLVEMGAPTPELFHMAPRTAVAAVVDAVRTRVLDWALALDESGVRGENMRFTEHERESAQSIAIHFNGSTNFAGVIGNAHGVGAAGNKQSHTFHDAACDIARKLHESADDLDGDDALLLGGAADSVHDAAKNREPVRLKKALIWAKAALAKVATFAAKTTLEHEIDVVLDAIPI